MPDEMMFASCTCIVLAACCFSAAASSQLELIEETKILANHTTSRKAEFAIVELAHIGEEHRERNYGTITQKRKKIEKAVATGEGTKSSTFSEEIEETNNPFLVFEDDIYVYGRTIAAPDVDNDRPSGVTTVVSVMSDHNDFETKGDVNEDLSDENDYDTTNAANEINAPLLLAEQLAFNEYRAQTNFIPRTKTEKYAQLLASYRFLKLAKGNDWTDLDGRTRGDTGVTETIDYSTDLDAVKELIDPRRQKILEYIKRQTYLAFRKKVDNMSTMGPGSVSPAPATPASAIFGSPPPQCPKKKITFKASTLGAKLSVRKPRRGYNDYSGAFDNPGITLCVWCKKLQKCTSGSDYNQPLLSACHFSETCNPSKDPVTVPTTDYGFYKK